MKGQFGMFEWLLLNVETYPAATAVAQQSLKYFKNYAAWAPLHIEPRKINKKRYSRP